jgi:hypothetical protein
VSAASAACGWSRAQSGARTHSDTWHVARAGTRGARPRAGTHRNVPPAGGVAATFGHRPSWTIRGGEGEGARALGGCACETQGMPECRLYWVSACRIHSTHTHAGGETHVCVGDCLCDGGLVRLGHLHAVHGGTAWGGLAEGRSGGGPKRDRNGGVDRRGYHRLGGPVYSLPVGGRRRRTSGERGCYSESSEAAASGSLSPPSSPSLSTAAGSSP